MVAPDGRTVSHFARLDFPTTNNASEYEALLLGLRKAKALGAKRILIKTDSYLVAGHFDGSFTRRDPKMASYLAAVRAASTYFLGLTVQAIPRSDNEAADKLAKMASSGQRPPLDVFLEVLTAPSVAQGVASEAQRAAPEAQGAAPGAQDAAHSVLLVTEADWRGIIIKYLAGEELEDAAETRRLQHRARNYHMIGGKLYKGASAPPSCGACPRKKASPS